jgi:hypothetical protein
MCKFEDKNDWNGTVTKGKDGQMKEIDKLSNREVTKLLEAFQN